MVFSFPAVVFAMIQSITAPETSRIVEKLAGSIRVSPSAILQRIEFAAKAIKAKAVSSIMRKTTPFVWHETITPLKIEATLPYSFFTSLRKSLFDVRGVLQLSDNGLKFRVHLWLISEQFYAKCYILSGNHEYGGY